MRGRVCGVISGALQLCTILLVDVSEWRDTLGICSVIKSSDDEVTRTVCIVTAHK